MREMHCGCGAHERTADDRVEEGDGKFKRFTVRC